MEKRDVNISFYKAGNGGISNRITLPKKWVEKIGITPDDRNVEIILDEKNNSIIIKKK
jgi:hypothetical protein|nr:MAG TPA: Toxin SymE, type I toxin-antitoxin system [Caudoviricetes sp.]